MMLSCCSFLFLTVFFLPSFLLVSSSPGPSQAAVPFEYSCSSVATHGMQHLLANVLFHVPLPPPVPAYVSLSHSSSHLFLCLVFFPSHLPTWSLKRMGLFWLATFQLRKSFHQGLCWSGQKVCPPATQAVGLSAQSYPPLQDLASAKQCRVRKSKTMTCASFGVTIRPN